MTFFEVLVAVVLGLVANEIFDITPWAANRLVRTGAAFAYPGDRGRDRAEEWMALLHDRPGKLFKLMTALGLCAYAVKVGIGHRAGVRLAEFRFRWRRDVRSLRQALRQPGTISLVSGAWLIGDVEDGLTLVELRYCRRSRNSPL